jgi:hypothetical protein
VLVYIVTITGRFICSVNIVIIVTIIANTAHKHSANSYCDNNGDVYL